jgi:hypothetical protein
MKIKDLPEDSNVKVSDLKVKLPEHILEFANQFSSKISKEVWLVGPMMGDWFVKINRDDTRVYPLFRDNITFSELSEWEVVEIFGIKI